MASPTPSSKRSGPDFSRYPPRPPAAMPDTVDPRWLLRALALAVLAAAILGYLSVCLLVYQGGWQLLLAPSARIDQTPSAPFQALRFDAAETGSPRLAAWWIPAASPLPNTPTLLFLHDGSGSLSAAVRTLNLLHGAPVNIFAFDYRGYGQSAGPHPTEARMLEDANAALDYLVNTRHLPAASIVPYGQGLGAVLAARLSAQHSELPAFILDMPDPGAFDRATSTGKARLLPMRQLVQEHFDLAAALAGSTKPKLLFADSPFSSEAASLRANEAFFRTVPNPKITVAFDHIGSDQAFVAALTRFVDEYLPPHKS